MQELYIYDVIGAGFREVGVTGEYVRDELAKMDKAEPVTVRINSPGGSVFDGIAIRAQLERWAAGVNVVVDGQASSIASYIATVGHNVSMAEGSMIMIHDPWTMAVGNAAEMQKAAETLDQVAESMVGAYAKKSGKSNSEIREAMKAETWLSADGAIEYGLANEKANIKAMAIVIPETFGFKHPPQAAESPKRPYRNELAAMRRSLDLL